MEAQVDIPLVLKIFLRENPDVSGSVLIASDGMIVLATGDMQEFRDSSIPPSLLEHSGPAIAASRANGLNCGSSHYVLLRDGPSTEVYVSRGREKCIVFCRTVFGWIGVHSTATAPDAIAQCTVETSELAMQLSR